jgi:hypothetical protein
MARYHPEDVAAVYAAMFFSPGRHGRWSSAAGHWIPTLGDPSIAAIVASLAGTGDPLATFFLGDDDRTHVFALDADTSDGLDVSSRVACVLLDAGIQSYVEASRRGAHVWVALDRAVPAIVARAAMTSAIGLAGFAPSTKLEIRPNCNRRSSEFAGGSGRAPWQRHPETGTRYPLLDPRTMKPVHSRIAGALLAMELAEADLLPDLTISYVPPEPRHRTVAATRSAVAESETISGVLARAFRVIVEPGRSLRCPLHDDRRASAKVSADDLRLWCWSPSCPAHENGRGVSVRMLAEMAAAVTA